MNIGGFVKMAFTDFSQLPPGVRHAVQLWLVTAMFIVHVSWACGWIPGVSGFAFAADIDHVADQLSGLSDDVRKQSVDATEERILLALANTCAAEDLRVKRLHQERLQKLLRRYIDLTNTAYPLQSCQ